MTLAATNLRECLGTTEILRGIDLAINTGEIIAVVGPNGSGKSTLVRSLAGLLKPISGTATVEGKPVARMPPRVRASKLGLLAQSADIPEMTTVQEHVSLGRHSQRRRLARWSADDSAAVQRVMKTCEVSHLAQRRMEDLSGGERQRARLATLLAQDPQILLLDEPLTGLDIEHQLGLLHLLRRLNTDRNRTVVCVLHDLDLALRFFDRVVVIDDGKIAADGPPREVLCPRIFESVFRVDGRIGCEIGGEPVIMCRQCRRPEDSPLVEVAIHRQSISPGAMPVATTKKAIDMTAQHIEHKPANAPQPDSLALMLKQSTQDLHNQAEAGPFQQRMMDGKLLREEFVAFLQQVWHVQSGIEPLFREAAAKEPRFAEMLHENHFRLSKIEQDLSDLDAAPIDERLASTEKFIGFVEQATRSDPLSLVGVLYVKEGATNGNKIVAKRIREGLGLPESRRVVQGRPARAIQRIDRPARRNEQIHCSHRPDACRRVQRRPPRVIDRVHRCPRRDELLDKPRVPHRPVQGRGTRPITSRQRPSIPGHL